MHLQLGALDRIVHQLWPEQKDYCEVYWSLKFPAGQAWGGQGIHLHCFMWPAFVPVQLCCKRDGRICADKLVWQIKGRCQTRTACNLRYVELFWAGKHVIVLMLELQMAGTWICLSLMLVLLNASSLSMKRLTCRVVSVRCVPSHGNWQWYWIQWYIP